MKIQTRLSLYSSVVFGVVFIVIAVIIYSLFSGSSRRTVYGNLEKNAYIIAWFYLEEDELDKEEFAHIHSEFDQKVGNNYFQLYNERDGIEYGSQFSPIPHLTLEYIRSNGSLAFRDGEFFCYGIYYEDNQGDFVVVAREKTAAADHLMSTLVWILSAAFVIGIIVIIVLSKWISGVAYRPFRKVIRQVRSISTDNPDMRVDVPPTQDELQSLIETYNVLLARISGTLAVQKNFVSYVSHELRTPLASMMGNLEVFSLKERSPEEYAALAHRLVEQIGQLSDIIDTLLVVSDLRNSSDVTQQVRVDEVVWEIVARISQQYPASDIDVQMEVATEEEQVLTVDMDRTQALLALFNLIENAVKFSQGKQVVIRMYKHDGKLCVSVTDRGIGIPAEKLENISRPFSRAENAASISGSGIGLTIALRIFEKNGIRYSIVSTVDVGTTIIVFF